MCMYVVVRICAVGSQGPTEEEDQEAKITSYEEALMKIKDATGVASIQEVVERFSIPGSHKTAPGESEGGKYKADCKAHRGEGIFVRDTLYSF